jgi:hypothetical protein
MWEYVAPFPWFISPPQVHDEDGATHALTAESDNDANPRAEITVSHG